MRRTAALTILILLGGCDEQEPGPEPASPQPTVTSPSPVIQPTGDAIELEAEDIAFDRDRIEVPPGVQVAIELKNRDDGIPHNFAVYQDESAAGPIFQGETIVGDADRVYTFESPSEPGDYFFRCDVHPTRMTGTLAVG